MAEPTNMEIAALFAQIRQKMDIFTESVLNFTNGDAAYVSGPVSGSSQPAPGWYPAIQPSGIVTWFPCTALIRTEAAKVNFERRRLTSGATIVLLPEDGGKTLLVAGPSVTSNINVRLPTTVPLGWAVNVIQEGSGGARVTFTTATGSDGEPLAYLRHRGNAFRLTNQWAMAVAVCTNIDSASRRSFVLSGDMTI